MLQEENLLAKIGFDTAENGPSAVWQIAAAKTNETKGRALDPRKRLHRDHPRACGPQRAELEQHPRDARPEHHVLEKG